MAKRKGHPVKGAKERVLDAKDGDKVAFTMKELRNLAENVYVH